MELMQLLDLWKKQFNLSDTKDLQKKILIYKDFLQQENQKYNLTRLDKPDIVYDQYFYQSLINFSNELFLKPNMNVLDIGSGSGIPGILVKLIFDDINLYIVESNQKKCNFLKMLVEKLELKNVFIFNKRCEDFIKEKLNFFDLITCRAVAELNILIELAIPGLKLNGVAYFLKSSNYLNELNKAKKISDAFFLDYPQINIIEYENKAFVSLKYIKQKQIDKKYPRSWKEIVNNG